MTTYNPVDLISKKRDGGTLTRDEYEWFITSWLAQDGSVMESQVSALLMAGVMRGFSKAEARHLTDVMLHSGEILDLSGLSKPTVDKHSTGGVGDGTTLILAPLLASCGVQVIKLSGRGLAHTGGTLDKLESIPGFNVNLSRTEIMAIGEQVGCVVAAQTGSIVPADKALYALRDVTGTVASQALIASSVMSKKLASGADTIVLDIKVGEGAFMQDLEAGRALAALCVDIGKSAGRNCRAITSNMNTPLSGGIGNSLEVVDVIEALSSTPAGRFAEVTLTLAALALSEATKVSNAQARQQVMNAWTSGQALQKFAEMIKAQGGDPRVVEDPNTYMPQAPERVLLSSPASSKIGRIKALEIGKIAGDLGAGRKTSGDSVDPTVGLYLHVEEGEAVEKGQPICTIHAKNRQDVEVAKQAIQEAILFATHAEPAPTVYDVL